MISKRIQLILAILLVLIALVARERAGADASVTILVRDQGQASASAICLSDIASITCSDAKLADRLRGIDIGNAPLPNCVRTLNRGDVFLKLRQSGFDPSKMSITGAETVHVSSADAVVSDVIATKTATNDTVTTVAAVAKPVVVVKSGATLSLVYSDGTITIECAGIALSGGAVGDTIMVRPSFSGKPLEATILDSRTVQLKD